MKAHLLPRCLLDENVDPRIMMNRVRQIFGVLLLVGLVFLFANPFGKNLEDWAQYVGFILVIIISVWFVLRLARK